MINLHEILEKLSKERPIFHSEADFQHALAWKIHEEFPNINIRLEKPFRGICNDKENSKPWYIDIFCFDGEEKFAIELKYKTRELKVKKNGEEFDLKSQEAQDIARYDFIKDISRLEKLVELSEINMGFAIFLTNDPLYWSKPSKRDTNDEAFRIHESKILSGILDWANSTPEGTKQGRNASLKLTHSYKIKWHRYSNLEGDDIKVIKGKALEFKYILVKVPP